MAKVRPAGPPNPFETFLLVACVLQGVLVILGIAEPRTIERALSPVLYTTWALMLTGGGLLALAGLYWPGDPYTGIEVKRVGLAILAAATAAYGIALLFLGPQGVVAGTTNLAFAAACLGRMWQVRKIVRQYRRHLAAVRGESSH